MSVFSVFKACSSIAGVMHACVIIFNVRENIKGKAEGELNVSIANVGLKAELQKLSTESAKGSDLQVNYYSTGLPDKLPINIEGLTELIENFPSRMKEINDGKGIPVTVRILFVSSFVSLYYKLRRGFKLGMTENKSSKWPLA